MTGLTEESKIDFYRRWHTLAAPYFRWQFEQFAPWVGRRVADVGCGPGNLTAALPDRELYLGIDADPAMLTELRSEFSGAGNVTTAVGDVTNPAIAGVLRSHRIDTVLCLNLLEHVQDDTGALANLVAGLPVGGVLGLLVPAIPALFGTLDKLDLHFRRYLRRDVVRLLSQQPLEVLRVRYFNMIGALGWLWAGRVQRLRRLGDGNYRAMNRLLPLVRPLERIVPPPFGLSVIAVARRV